MCNQTVLKTAEDVWEKYHLNGRADVPFNGAIAMLKDAADALTGAWMKAFEQQALTPDLVQTMHEVASTITDACILAAADPQVPQKGVVKHNRKTGVFRWQPSQGPGAEN